MIINNTINNKMMFYQCSTEQRHTRPSVMRISKPACPQKPHHTYPSQNKRGLNPIMNIISLIFASFSFSICCVRTHTNISQERGKYLQRYVGAA